MNAMRIKRINSEFQKAAYEPVNEIVNSVFKNIIVSITKVDTTEDLAECKIYISVFAVQGTINADEVIKHVNNNAAKVREHLAHTVNLRITPKIRFILDESLSKIEQINKVIDKINGGRTE